jgi:hypothetical protein
VNAEIFAQGKTSRIPSPTPRSGVRLNRKRRTAEEGFLFEQELFEPGHPWQFAGQITYEGEAPDSLVLLYMAANSINMLGSGRSRGLGWSEVLLTEFDNSTVPELEEVWNRWITTQRKVKG